jgi:hypothetical protein
MNHGETLMGWFDKQYRWTRIAMILVGIAFAVLYPKALWTSDPGWMWNTPRRNIPFENMLVAMYFVHGLFLIWGARDPIRYLPLIDFTIIANIVHATVMLYDANRLGLTANLQLGGDVPGTYLGPILLLLTHPRKFYLDGLFRRAPSG